MGLTTIIDNVLAEAQGDPAQIRKFCEDQRRNRNGKHEELLLQPEFPGMRPDEILASLLENPAYIDPRNNLCVWARPPTAVSNLILKVQQELQTIAPSKLSALHHAKFMASSLLQLSKLLTGIWLAPKSCLHMTALEIVHSQTPEQVNATVTRLQPFFRKLVQLPVDRCVKLVKPQLTFDDAAVALTFVPVDGCAYTYLHLRRDLSKICEEAGVQVESRYFNTSSHITIARVVSSEDLPDSHAVAIWVRKIESLNQWLRNAHWSDGGQATSPGIEWVVGAECEAEVRKGRLWYGGGETIGAGAATKG